MPTDTDFQIINERARKLAAADRRLKRDLIALRQEAGLRQADIAAFLGISPQAVQKLERYDSDPKLSTLRRYANAVGALINHKVVKDNASLLWNKSGVQGVQSEKKMVPAKSSSLKRISSGYKTSKPSKTAQRFERA